MRSVYEEAFGGGFNRSKISQKYSFRCVRAICEEEGFFCWKRLFFGISNRRRRRQRWRWLWFPKSKMIPVRVHFVEITKTKLTTRQTWQSKIRRMKWYAFGNKKKIFFCGNKKNEEKNNKRRGKGERDRETWNCELFNSNENKRERGRQTDARKEVEKKWKQTHRISTNLCRRHWKTKKTKTPSGRWLLTFFFSKVILEKREKKKVRKTIR